MLLSIDAILSKYPFVSKSWIYKRTHDKTLAHFKTGSNGGGKVIIEENDFLKLLQSRRVKNISEIELESRL